MFEFRGKIYVILDTEVISQKKLDIFKISDKLSLYGIDMFQLRAKGVSDRECLFLSQKLSKIIRRRRKIFIVNDRVDIAYLSGADGVHLGKDDISVSDARKILGRNKIVGKTTHSSKELQYFQNQDLDYLSIGPVFETKTKPQLASLRKGLLTSMIKKAEKPYFVIGGISLSNISKLKGLGISNIAVCRGIILSKDYKNVVARFRQCLREVS
ncbi:MAG: thiamine phosphate synthase [Candidatus Omnitrophota bacterium]|nr:MAG: thiamine phosphate synthase [Candidatus Omnitrophota bacterium]